MLTSQHQQSLQTITTSSNRSQTTHLLRPEEKKTEDPCPLFLATSRNFTDHFLFFQLFSLTATVTDNRMRSRRSGMLRGWKGHVTSPARPMGGVRPFIPLSWKRCIYYGEKEVGIGLVEISVAKSFQIDTFFLLNHMHGVYKRFILMFSNSLKK